MLAYLAGVKAQAGIAVLATGGLAAVSAALCLFCLYNVMAGGNPPRKGSH